MAWLFLMMPMDIVLLIIPFTRAIGICAGILTSVSTVPQLIKIIKEKKAEDVSVGFLLVLILGLILWIWYAFEKNDIILLMANAFSVLVNLAVLFFKYRYSKQYH